MNLPERKRDKETIELLQKLKTKMFSRNISTARFAAHHLGWLQEDGLCVLKEVLFSDYSINVKKVATYGLRCMRGRMTKQAKEVLELGINNKDINIQKVCLKSLKLMNRKM